MHAAGRLPCAPWPGGTIDGIECHHQNYPLFNIGDGDRYWTLLNQQGVKQ